MRLPEMIGILPIVQVTWTKKGVSDETPYITFMAVSGKDSIRCICFDDPENHDIFKKCTELKKGSLYSIQGRITSSTLQTKNGESYITNFLKVTNVCHVDLTNKKSKPDFNYGMNGFGE